MNGTGSAIGTIVALLVLLFLVGFVIRGGTKMPMWGFNHGSSHGGGGRSWFELVLAMFALANLIASPAAEHLGIPLLIAAVALLAVFSYLPGASLLIVVLGVAAGVANIFVTQGHSAAVGIVMIVVLLSWLAMAKTKAGI